MLYSDYQQACAGVAPVQAALMEEEGEAGAAPADAAALPLPASMPEQARRAQRAAHAPKFSG